MLTSAMFRVWLPFSPLPARSEDAHAQHCIRRGARARRNPGSLRGRV